VANDAQGDCDKDGLGDVCDSSSQCGVRYSQAFTQNQTPSGQCTEWNNFRSQLTATYTKVTISGSYDTTGVSCTGSTADAICKALKNSTTGTWSCNGRNWLIGGCGGGIELSAAGNMCTCTSTNYIVRPCIGNYNWGGANTETCNAPSQTLNVVCE
jgi:hypothetical protein